MKLIFNATVFHCVKYDVLSYLVPLVVSLSDVEFKLNCVIDTAAQRSIMLFQQPQVPTPILLVCVTNFVRSQFGETRLVGICRTHPWFTAT